MHGEVFLLARFLQECFPFYQVLRGADRNIDFLIKDSNNGVLDSHLWTSTGASDREIKTDGNVFMNKVKALADAQGN